MDLNTAVRLVVKDQLGIYVETKEEAQAVIECAQRPPGSERLEIDANLEGVPDRFPIFGHGSGEIVLTWWRDNGVFASTHDLVEAASLLCRPINSSAISNLL